MQESKRLITSLNSAPRLDIKGIKSNLHHYLVDLDTLKYLQKLFSAFHHTGLTNFLEAPEQLNYFGNDAISLISHLQFCEVA